jgi:cellulose biosynthesis protein BcsQ
VEQVRNAYNPDLSLDGLVINHVRNTNGHRGYSDVLQEIYGDVLLWPPIPVRSVISDARDACMPVEHYERRYRSHSPAAPIFREIAAGLARRAGLVTRPLVLAG